MKKKKKTLVTRRDVFRYFALQVRKKIAPPPQSKFIQVYM